MLTVEWHPFSYEDKQATRPPHGYQLYWIMEMWDGGVNLGYFDGYTWRLYGGSDDCSVSHWAEIVYPEPPQG